MKQEPRKTLVLALLVAFGLLGVLVVTLTLRGDDEVEIRTSTVLEMVASLDGGFQRVAFEAAPPPSQPFSWWSCLLVLVPLVAWMLYRGHAQRQQQSRSKLS